RFPSTREIVVALEYVGTGVSAVTGAAPVVSSPSVEISAAAPPATRPRLFRRAALPIGAVVVVILAAFAWYRFGAAKRPIDSLAILPFATGGGQPDAEYLGNGLSENLIEQLSRVPSLRVMARATVFRFRGAADPQDVGRKLGVGAVLTGSVARHGDDLSITAELIDTSNGVRLWGTTYDRPVADLLTVQDEIASAVSTGLRLPLSEEEERAVSLHGTHNAEA